MCADMSMLLELQMRLRRAVLGGDTAEIVTAIRKRDRAAARAQMLSHLREIEAELFLKESSADELRLADVLGA